MEIYRRCYKKYGFPFLAAALCVLLEALCDLMQPTIMADIIDRGVKNRQIPVILHFGVQMLVITFLGALFATARNILSSRVSQSFGADLRFDVFRKIMRLSESAPDPIDSGSLITRVTNDTAQVTQFVNGMMRIFFKAPVTCLGSIVLAVMLSPRLSLVLFAVVFLVSALIVASMKLSYSRFAKVQSAVDKVNRTVQEYLLGVRLVKAFGRYGDEKKKFDGVNRNVAERSVASQMVIVIFSPLMSLAVSLGIAASLFFGSVLFRAGQIDVGRIAAYINYMTQILASLIMITNIFNTFVRTKASNERILQVLRGEEDSGGSLRAFRDHSGRLSFRNVTFAYPSGSGTPAVRNLSFSLDPGETLAVIGPTGSGKSTVAWLCLHFYEAKEGAVLYNGTNVNDLDTKVLREQIALAPQKSMLFSGTVFENIALGRPGASEREVVEAAEIAQADGFIREMPEGYNSILGQGGVNLSGGQKQRISIARALVRNSPVLILDDCTSALDSVTEAKVRRGLKAAGNGKSVILITQKAGTAMAADQILVLDDGARAGYGSHRELLRTCAVYREIYESQIGTLRPEAEPYGG
ncbi:MAG: ABC transporter ATP-binding protein/permease [Oscillospiraceae bacterium]|nr:ABC transporter ATP-binding protein/permease [Oscillospiraceae bacterium]MCI1990595.1 ABC transporter ATP-binding protein/permease [Oscillospiraceae bacterium]MCI2035983.1 ABC transporter ATP-binding protein/permease [Oscillospiraceae bacterium]